MVGYNHELPVLFLQYRPDTAPQILREVDASQLPKYHRSEIGCTDLSSFPIKEHKADAVTVLYREDDTKLLAIVTEIQLRTSEEKRYTWPQYVTNLREKLRCPVQLLVVCPDMHTTEWARGLFDIETDKFALIHIVVGPDNMPVVDDPEKARRHPEVAVLSAAAHGDSTDVLDAAQAALDAVSPDRVEYYYDYIVSNLSTAAREHWEARMETLTYGWQHDVRSKWAQEGRDEGRAEAAARHVVALLETRGIALTDEQRAAVRDCTDAELLDTWFDRALTAAAAEDVFTD
ncbi:hypothetical protein [Streptomonospora salina]|uniref:Uncharacterized protein n=1 Tax=Streptomonospora salina TaxID=104205 RepID=A0A841E9J4_9ACTN|nr:hypothetical protein [Streptomonospora salina]MBB5997768.1 hypothetical protein [Streptomonospora salina]